MSQLPIASTSAKVAGDACIKDFRNANEQVVGGVIRSEFGQLLVDGFPEALKTMTFPEVEDGGGLHFAVRANGASLRVIELVLLRITPMGLQLKPEESRLDVLVYSA